MDSNTYEQIELMSEFVGDRAAFLQDGMTVTVGRCMKAGRSASPCPSM